MRKHNDPTIDFHVSLYDYVVIGNELIAERDVMRINLSSVWMLANALRAIIAGWNFQLCADVTCNFCNSSVDLLEFSVTSIPCQSNVLCLSIIPKATESETVYKLSFDDLRKAVNYLCKIQPCGSADCECCIRIRELLCERNIVDFIASSEFEQQKVQVQTTMSDNFQGFSNFCRAEFGIDPILCKPHATGKDLCCICRLCVFLILSPAGIAASQNSHVNIVKYFPNQDEYNEYNDFVVDICDIGIESFATRAQTMLVDHLSKHYGDAIANWCKTFWSEARGRMCLAHSRYAGCNNNMGTEVSWRDIKKLLPPNCSLGQFLGVLCHYIKTALGEEHMQRLLEVFSGNSFVREPIATKDMWDGVQSAHSKTLSCSFVLATASKRANLAIELRDMMEEIMEYGQRTLALHLKIAAWHEDVRQLGQCPRLALGELNYSRATTGLTQATGSDGRALGTNASHTAATTGAPVREACHSG